MNASLPTAEELLRLSRAKHVRARLEEAIAARLSGPWETLLNLSLETDPGREGARLAEAEKVLAALRSPAEEKPSIEFVDRASIWAPLAPVRYPLQNFALSPGAPAIFLAYAFGGKTIILQDLLLSVALGLKAWRHWPCTQGRVVHLDYEQGERETKDRYQRLARGHGLDLVELRDAPIDLAVYPRAHLWSPGAEDDYKRAFEGASLALIDTFGAASPGRDENDTQIAEALYMLARVSKETDCLVIVAHHMGKAALSEKGAKADPRTLARGSTAIVAAAGYVYAMGGAKGEPKLVQQVKGRGLGDPPMEDFYLELKTKDCRQEYNYFNPSVLSDVGGFEVLYRTVEQIKPPKPPKEESLNADCEALLGFFREEHVRSRGVGSATAAVKGAKLRKGDGLAAFETIRARRLIHDRGKRGAHDWWISNPLPGTDQP